MLGEEGETQEVQPRKSEESEKAKNSETLDSSTAAPAAPKAKGANTSRKKATKDDSADAEDLDLSFDLGEHSEADSFLPEKKGDDDTTRTTPTKKEEKAKAPTEGTLEVKEHEKEIEMPEPTAADTAEQEPEATAPADEGGETQQTTTEAVKLQQKPNRESITQAEREDDLDTATLTVAQASETSVSSAKGPEDGLPGTREARKDKTVEDETSSDAGSDSDSGTEAQPVVDAREKAQETAIENNGAAAVTEAIKQSTEQAAGDAMDAMGVAAEETVKEQSRPITKVNPQAVAVVADKEQAEDEEDEEQGEEAGNEAGKAETKIKAETKTETSAQVQKETEATSATAEVTPQHQPPEFNEELERLRNQVASLTNRLEQANKKGAAAVQRGKQYK